MGKHDGRRHLPFQTLAKSTCRHASASALLGRRFADFALSVASAAAAVAAAVVVLVIVMVIVVLVVGDG